MTADAEKMPGRRSVSSGVWALVVAFVAPIILIVIGELLGTRSGAVSVGERVAWCVYGVLVAGACFVLSRREPRSAWYVPLICNIAGIFAACVEPTFWTTPLCLAFGTVALASVVAAIAGRRLGRRAKAQGEPESR